MKSSVVVCLALLLATPAAAGTIAGMFRIGPTGIYCVKAPCPWRGIVKLDADGKPEGRPLWAGDELPVIEAEAGVRDSIATIWRASGCLIVEGELHGDRFAVARIVGDC
jgi:hypothetical protein